MNIKDLVVSAHANAVSKGFHDAELDIPQRLCLIHSEVSEALEDYRDGNMNTVLDDKGKPCGFPSEIADIVIRVADLCGRLGIDLESEIKTKMAYNATRSHKHGGKRC